VVNNDGGGIFSLLEQAAFPAPFERVFGTPTGAALSQVAAAAGIPAVTLARASDLAGALKGEGLPGTGIRMVEVRTGRAAGTALRARLRAACTAAAARSGPG
jgi:2-succinyl-5-enolpyruvyl-6-hydroxy-3-cyclohexene-1-carboxylate synthase